MQREPEAWIESLESALRVVEADVRATGLDGSVSWIHDGAEELHIHRSPGSVHSPRGEPRSLGGILGTGMLRCLSTRVGDQVEVLLTFQGEVAETDESDSLRMLGGGQVRIIGTVGNRVDHSHDSTAGTLITSGGVQFAIEGEAPRDRVLCTGRLSEQRYAGRPD